MARVLVVDDEQAQRSMLARVLRNAGYEVEAAGSGDAALEIVQSTPVDIVVTDIRMPGMNGRELLASLKELDAELPVIIMTAYADLQDAVELVTHHGASYYIEKPIEDLSVLKREIDRNVGREDGSSARDSRATAVFDGPPGFEGIVGTSGPMLQLKREIQRLLPLLGGPATVLITGESGTGKELVAHALHGNGPRKNAPFVPVHCAAIPSELMEAELFGAEKGAYTGSTRTRAGYFQEAGNGTVFLDEIAEMSLLTQVKLLRVVAEREYNRVGSSKQLEADVCVMAATNRDLEEEVREKRFRDDLYYRLNVFRLHVPSLRTRRDDIPALVDHLLARFTAAFDLPAKRCSKDALGALRRFSWPGNVRQLDHYLQQAVVMSDTDEIQVGDLPAETNEPVSEPVFLSEVLERGMSLEDVEHQLILAALDRSDGNQTSAAKLLGVSRRKLQYRMDKHHISSHEFRENGDDDEEDDDEASV